jgi:hypothetical protein
MTEGLQPSMGGTSRVTGDSQARFCEGLGVKFPGPTRPGLDLGSNYQLFHHRLYSVHERFGDSGGKKRTAWLAKTLFRQLCLCELSLFTFNLAPGCLVSRSGRFARKNPGTAIGRFDC